MAILVIIKVMPSAGKQLFMLDKTGRLKCYLKSPPQKGQANLELVKFLAQALNLTQQKIAIVAGLTSRNKKIKIDTPLDYDQILQQLGLSQLSQHTIF